MTLMFMFMFMIMILLSIQVGRLNPIEASECSNSRPNGSSVTRGQGDPWSVWYCHASKLTPPSELKFGSKRREWNG
jgi:hypothetical protein